MKNLMLFCLIIVLSVGCTSAQSSVQQKNIFYDEQSINDLEAIIKDAEKQGNVSARSHIHQYWQLADLYLKNMSYQNAYTIIDLFDNILFTPVFKIDNTTD